MTTARQTVLPPSSTIAAAVSILKQCAAFLEELDDGIYTRPSRVISGSTVGQHVRHCLDHFHAAAAGLDGELIDYDHRERDTPIEKSRAEGRDAALALADRIGLAQAESAELPARVRIMISGSGDEALVASTVARELWFAAHHAIHHHAMMAAIAGEFGHRSPPGFGKAPSTIEHQARTELVASGARM